MQIMNLSGNSSHLTDGDGSQILERVQKAGGGLIINHLALKLSYRQVYNALCLAGFKVFGGYEYQGNIDFSSQHITLDEVLPVARLYDTAVPVYVVDTVEQLSDNASWCMAMQTAVMVVIDSNFRVYNGRDVMQGASSAADGAGRNWKNSRALYVFELVRAACTLSNKIPMHDGEQLLKAYVVQLVYCAGRETIALCREQYTGDIIPGTESSIHQLRFQLEPLKACLGIGPDDWPEVGRPVQDMLKCETVFGVVESIQQLVASIPALGIPSMHRVVFNETAW